MHSVSRIVYLFKQRIAIVGPFISAIIRQIRVGFRFWDPALLNEQFNHCTGYAARWTRPMLDNPEYFKFNNIDDICWSGSAAKPKDTSMRIFCEIPDFLDFTSYLHCVDPIIQGGNYWDFLSRQDQKICCNLLSHRCPVWFLWSVGFDLWFIQWIYVSGFTWSDDHRLMDALWTLKKYYGAIEIIILDWRD